MNSISHKWISCSFYYPRTYELCPTLNVLYGFRLTLFSRHKKRKNMPKQSPKSYSETFKLEVVIDYYISGLSKISTAKKWGLSSHSVLIKWLHQYPIDSDLLSLPPELISELKMKDAPKSKEQLLEEEVLRLRKALELEKLRSHAFKKLIETTEKEEGISILKKDGAK